MSKVKEYITALDHIINDTGYTSRMSEQTLKSLIGTKDLLNKVYLSHPRKKSNGHPINITIKDISRVKNESFSSIILFVVQNNNGPVCISPLIQFIINSKIFPDRNYYQIVCSIKSAIQFLMKSEDIRRIGYGTYEITEKGKGIYV